MSTVDESREQVPAIARELLETGSSRLGAWTFDAEAYLAGSEYLSELAEAAAGPPVPRAGDHPIAPPLLVRVDPRNATIRLGRHRLRSLRPSAVVAELRRIRARDAGNLATFSRALYKTHRFVNMAHGRDDERAVDLETIYDAMTLAPGTEYTREQFIMDLVRLHARPDLRTSDHRRVEFPASTASRGKRIVAYTEEGKRLDLVAVRFVREARTSIRLEEWLDIVRRDHIEDFINNGGSTIEFVVSTHDDSVSLKESLCRMADQNRVVSISIDAGEARVHMIHDVFFVLRAAWIF
jgi:hypothetical protein